MDILKLKTMRISLIIFCFFSLLMIPSMGYGANLISDILTEKGIEYYNQGEYDEAIHELSKALLANPDDKKALEYLNKMGLTGGIYGAPESVVFQAGKIAGRVVAYRQSLWDMEKEKEFIERKNKSLETRLETFHKKMRRQQEEKHRLRQVMRDLAKEARAQKRYIREIESSLDEKAQQVVHLNTDLYDLVGYLDKREALLERGAENFQALEESYRSSRRRWLEEGLEYQMLLTEMEGRGNRQKDSSLQVKEQGRQEVQDLQDRLRTVVEKKKEAEDQLLLIGKKLAVLDNEISPKDRTMAALPSTESDMGLLSTRPQEEKPAGGKPLQRDLREIRWIERKDRVIADKKESIDQIRTPFESVAQGTEGYPAESMGSFKKHLQETGSRLEQTRFLLDEKDADYRALQQRFRDTQERLGIVEDMLKEKEGQIHELEKRLTDFLTLPE